MPVVRINEFKAKVGQEKELEKFLSNIVPTIQSFEGCLSCELLSSQDDKSVFLVVETWESVEVHQRSAENIPVEEIQKVMSLLAEAPGGQYFTKLDEQMSVGSTSIH